MNAAIVVLGYGKSTQAAIHKLHTQYSALIYIYDEGEQTLDLPNYCIQVKDMNEVPMKEVLFCLKSPGIPYTKGYVQVLLDHQIQIYTDVELFLSDVRGKIIAITGSNGKTTVTTLISEVLKQKFDDVRVCGNIGIPIAEVYQESNENTIFVVEVSSFQLKGVTTFKPDIAILLNLADSHLDYHGTLDDYTQAKAQIFSQQESDDILIYNSDDTRVVELIQAAQSTCLAVGHNSNADIMIESEMIRFHGQEMNKKIIKVPGAHNHFNSAIAFSVGVLCGVAQADILSAISKFSGVKHRLQYVDTINGRMVYNDSKSTNEFSIKTALSAFNRSLVWICGGYDRGIPYTHITTDDITCVKHMVIYGMMTPKFLEIAQTFHIPHTVVNHFEEVFDIAMQEAISEETILFSPGAASYDVFSNFEQRGDAFLSLVDRYKKNN